MNEKALSEGTPRKNRSKGHLAEPDNQSDKAIIYPNVSHLTGMITLAYKYAAYIVMGKSII